MKSLLLFSTFILFFSSPFLSFSQTYKVDEMRIYLRDGTPDWSLLNTQKFTYGNGGNKETKLETFIAPSTQATYQYTNVYDASNKIISQEKKNWVAGWKNFHQTIYDYDGNNKLTKETTKSWDAGSTTYATNVSQILYEYAGDDITLYTEQTWNAGWVNNLIVETDYTSPGVTSDRIISNFYSGTLLDMEKETVIYVSGVVDHVDYYDSDGSGGWELNGQRLIDYYGNGKIKTETQQIYDNPGWTDEYLDSYFYDANGNLSELISSSYDEDITDWVEDGKVEWDYSVATPFILSTKFFESEIFKVFPNPSSDIIYISSNVPIEKVELFDVVGKRVLSTSNSEQINIENLKSGIYLLKVFNNNRSATKRLVIK